MHIKPSDGATQARPSSIRPAVGSVPTPEPASLINLSISSEVRALTTLLKEALPGLGTLHVLDVLTPQDRLMLARAVQLVSSEEVALAELRKLVVDLGLYRLSTGAAQGASGPDEHRPLLAGALAPDAPRGVGAHDAGGEDDTPARPEVPHGAADTAQALRTPPLFSPRDERLALTILSSLAMHDTLVDPSFVRALLDPDRTPEHAVDFAFLRRLVIGLSASHADGATDTRVTGERREARTALSQAVASLSLELRELPTLDELNLAEGNEQLRQRWPMLASVARLEPAQASETLEMSAAGALMPQTPEAPTAAPQGRPASELPTAAPQGRPASEAPTTAPQGRLASVLAWKPADRALLRLLYAVATNDGDLERVDQVAGALHALRNAESRELAVRGALRPELPTAQRLTRDPDPPAALAPAVSPRRELSSAAPRRAVESQHEAMRVLPEPARSFGSSSQLAARIADSYARSAGDSAFPVAVPAAATNIPTRSRGALSVAMPSGFDPAREAAPLPTLMRPLNVAEALGVSGLVRELKARTLRTAQLRKRRFGAGNVRPLEGLREAAYDAEADDPPVLDTAQRRRRVRWQLLLERRKRRRIKPR